jgi:hypothetical protein
MKARSIAVAVLVNAMVAIVVGGLEATFITTSEQWVLDLLVLAFCSTLHFWYQLAQPWRWKMIALLPSAAVNALLLPAVAFWITGDSL